MCNLVPIVREFDQIIAGLIIIDKNKDDFVAFLALRASFWPQLVFKTHFVEIFKTGNLAKERLLLPVWAFVWTVDKRKYPFTTSEGLEDASSHLTLCSCVRSLQNHQKSDTATSLPSLWGWPCACDRWHNCCAVSCEGRRHPSPHDLLADLYGLASVPNGFVTSWGTTAQGWLRKWQNLCSFMLLVSWAVPSDLLLSCPRRRSGCQHLYSHEDPSLPLGERLIAPASRLVVGQQLCKQDHFSRCWGLLRRHYA